MTSDISAPLIVVGMDGSAPWAVDLVGRADSRGVRGWLAGGLRLRTLAPHLRGTSADLDDEVENQEVKGHLDHDEDPGALAGRGDRGAVIAGASTARSAGYLWRMISRTCRMITARSISGRPTATPRPERS